MTFYTTSFHGIGQITSRELRNRFGSDLHRIRTHRVRDYDITQFDYEGPVEHLLQLGTVEDLFCWLATHPLTGKKEDLAALQQTVQTLSLEPVLKIHRQTTQSPRKKRPAYRVIVQADSASWRHYRRNAMQRAVEQGVHQQFPRWWCAPDKAPLEFWVQQIGKEALIGLRLTDRTMRHRTYKIANMPGSLRPTIAHALVQLSHPEPGDVFLDPMCGAGTILIERALAGRYALLQGGDIQEEAVQYTLQNFGNRHQPREIHHWDAKDLPLASQSVHKVVTNLPWGRQIGSPEKNRTLYARALQEMDRVLKPNGTVVLLTSAWDLIKTTLPTVPSLILTEQITNITVLGRRADIFVLRKW